MLIENYQVLNSIQLIGHEKKLSSQVTMTENNWGPVLWGKATIYIFNFFKKN